jgi:hypothetical protein
MILVITHSIFKLEYGPLSRTYPLESIKSAAKQVIGGLGINLKNTKKIPHTKLIKIDITSSGGAGRCAFLLQLKDDIAVLIAIRNKNDRKIGRNMTVKNQNFANMLEKYYNIIFDEIRDDKFYKYAL